VFGKKNVHTFGGGLSLERDYAPGVPQPSWALGDFDYNGLVDDDDVTLLGAFYDPAAAPLVTPAPLMSGGGVSGEGVSGAGVAAVPEPGTVTMLITGLIALAAGTVRAGTVRRKGAADNKRRARWGKEPDNKKSARGGGSRTIRKRALVGVLGSQ
jgi:hypothetical protein